MKNIDDEAAISQNRAYGGIIRSGKGKLVENIAECLVRIAWEDVLGQDGDRMKINKKKMPIGISDGYIDRISDNNVSEYLKKHNGELVYKFGTDVQVFIDDELVLPIECKTYAENAMMKRILFDAKLMKEAMGTNTYYLVQLESQLGGDYSELKKVTYGSPATHALMSYVDVDLKIITLLKGERHVKRPIHKHEYFKELKISELQKAVNIFANDLKKYVE
ncbi:MAG: hypothetical protein J6M62_04710 [Selenomonadaceae bacterium]|nr:hypothetical protein [Selenomonadaceae bacterium]